MKTINRSLRRATGFRFVTLHTLILLLAAGVAESAVGELAPAPKHSIRPQLLFCEYRQNPQGIDTSNPRLSWKLELTDPETTDRGQRQRAYHLKVASSQGLLDERNRADLWDSGRVESSQSHLIPYAGKPLRSNQRCDWKVRVQDERGRWSDWSHGAFWTVGILDPSEWTAEWIGTDQSFERKPGWPPPDNTLPDPWFRKTFGLEQLPAHALIHVASVGYHELYLNGKRIGVGAAHLSVDGKRMRDEVLMPCVSDHNRRARYVTYDIASELRQGTNVIGLWLGTSWSIFPQYKAPGKPMSPIVLAQAEIDFANGKHQRIVTDTSWKTHPSPNTLIGVWDFMHFGGELYDANREVPNWCSVHLDDTAWKPATRYQPQLALSAHVVEPNHRMHELRPVAIAEPSPGVYRIDFGTNFTGWAEVPVAGNPGDRIEFKWSERAEEPMTHRLRSVYIIGPSGKGEFCNRFNYGVGRWLQIEGLRSKPDPRQIRGWLIRTGYSRAADFRCSDDLLNQIYQKTCWTFENLSLGGYVVDCAQRERMGYGGDAHATTETALDNYALGAFYTKWSEDWRDVQGKASAWGTNVKPGEAGAGGAVAEGNLPYTAPTYWGGGGPGWSGYCVTLPWEIYRRYGDRRILEVNLPTIERWLAFLETKAKDNLLRRWGGEWDFLGDWLWPGAEGVNGDTRETLFFNNCFWIYNLQTAAKVADALGRSELGARYRARSDVIRATVHREFYRPEDQSYVNGFQAYLSIALLVGLPPQELQPLVAQRLEKEIRVVRKGHFWGGITGGSFIVKHLLEAGRNDLLYEMATKDDYPSWGDMIRKGATTLWEDWEGKLSLSHSSYLHVGAFFIEGLGGIRPGPNGRGYEDFVIQPGLWKGIPLTSMRCHFDSPQGRIESRWQRNQGQIEFEVVVPPNTAATFHLPTGDLGSVREGQRPIGQSAGVRVIGANDTVTLLRLDPGRYTFLLPWR